MKIIRVMHVITDNKLYGAERVIFLLLKYLSQRNNFGINLTILALRGDCSDLAEAARRFVPGLDVRVVEMSDKYDLAAIISLRRIIIDSGIEVLHTHGYKADIIGFIASRFLKLKTVSTLHGWVGTDIKLALNSVLSKQVLRLFDKVVVVSGILARQTTRYVSKDKITCINNAVDISFLERIEASDLSKVFGFERGSKVVVYVGRLSQEKGVECLVRAAALMDNKNRRIVYLFIGDGPLMGSLKDLAFGLGVDKYIYFAGYRDDALSLLKSSSRSGRPQ